MRVHRTITLRETASIIMGQSPPGSTYNEQGIGLPFFQGIRDFEYRFPVPRVFCTAPTRIAKQGDILLSVRAPIGKVNVANIDCAIGRGLAIIRPRRESDCRYIEFALRSLESSWHSIEGSGSVFGNATKQDLEQLRIPWPEEHERVRIAHILGTLDDKIELNRRMNETLEQMARAIFKSWFVDFEPVQAKISGRWKKGESLPGLPAHLWDLFPDRLVPSKLGDIPEGWEAGHFGDIVKLQRNNEIPFNSPNLVFKYFSIPAFDNDQSPREEVGKKIRSIKYRVSPGAILISKLNPDNYRTWLVDVAPNYNAICSTEFLVFYPQSPIDLEFIFCLAQSDFFHKQLECLANGTSKSHQRIRPNDILNATILSYPRNLIESFSRLNKPLLDRMVISRREIGTLKALRNILITRIFSGGWSNLTDLFARSK